MNLIIDNRENDLIQLIESSDVIFKKKNLVLGDITFSKDDKDLLIIERKTLSDLIASIKDGRYREQKLRLINKQKENTQIYYLIEGNINTHKQKDLILSCIFNTMIRDNLKVIYSYNLKDTFDIIKKLIRKTTEFEKILSTDSLQDKESNNHNDYSTVIKSEKKSNMTKEICSIAMLKQIPGVSTKCAKSILNKYLNISTLILKYESLDDEDNKKLLLKDIIIEKKKIGTKLSEKIYNYLI